MLQRRIERRNDSEKEEIRRKQEKIAQNRREHKNVSKSKQSLKKISQNRREKGKIFSRKFSDFERKEKRKLGNQ